MGKTPNLHFHCHRPVKGDIKCIDESGRGTNTPLTQLIVPRSMRDKGLWRLLLSDLKEECVELGLSHDDLEIGRTFFK